MQSEVGIQIAFLLLTIGIFVSLYRLPKKALSKIRSSNRASLQSNRHFVQGAQFLSRARAARSPSSAHSLAKSALSEADNALSLNPRDPAAHILRALAQDLLGHKTSALKSLDTALSPPASKSLSGRERGDALVKRAELQLAVNRRRRVDSAVSDLVEAVSLSKDNLKAFCLLGQCYEDKGMKEDAVKAFQEALNLDSESAFARQALGRLSSSGPSDYANIKSD
ncbi:hypothetical protein V2J09_008861 [Rumex salicifolius]